MLAFLERIVRAQKADVLIVHVDVQKAPHSTEQPLIKR